MSSDGNTENLTELRRGFQVWDYNPSASKVRLNSKETTIKIEHGSKVLLINGDTSEVLGEGTAAFLKKHIVDDEQFMKVYVGQLDIMFNLSKTGQQIFQIVWDIIQKSKDKDQVMLKPVMAKLLDKKISERTFQRGVRELLEKEFIYMGPIDGLYYINMSIFFNGNRIIAATEYIRGSALNRLDSKVIEIGE
jgi:uncharacterized protein (UPF0332 family)